MKLRPLGRTGLIVSEIGFGTLGMGGEVYGPADDADSRSAVLCAVELGCRLFDTADVYGGGRSERVLGEVTGGAGEIAVATKAGKAAPDALAPHRLRDALEGSRQRLRRDVIDVFQIHDPPLGAVLDPRLHELMDELKAAHLVRAAGVSVVSPSDGIEAVLCGKWDVVQVEASLVAPEATRRLFPLAAERGIGIIVRVPLGHGVLSGRFTAESHFAPGDIRANAPLEVAEHYRRIVDSLRFLADGTGRTPTQAALRYLLDQPGVSSVIPGIRSARQAREAMAASGVPTLSPGEREQVLHVQERAEGRA
jgi:aryl-alcohol dehydrogenase-like predicted oxidoreductase